METDYWKVLNIMDIFILYDRRTTVNAILIQLDITDSAWLVKPMVESKDDNTKDIASEQTYH